MPPKPTKKFSGIEFRVRDHEIFFPLKYKNAWRKYFKRGAEIISENNLDINKILKEFKYDLPEANEFVTAKMSFYANQAYGVFLPCREDELKYLASVLIGKSSLDREERTGEPFNIDKWAY